MACQTENTKCRHRKQFLWLILILIFFFGLRASSVLPLEPLDGVRSLADGKRFDYVVWTLKALFNKAMSASLGVEKFLNDEQQATIVKAYFDQVGVVEEKERALEDVLYHSSFDESQFQLANEDLNEARTWLKKTGASCRSNHSKPDRTHSIGYGLWLWRANYSTSVV